MIISIIIDKLINEPKFVLFIKNNITKFIILINKQEDYVRADLF